MHILAAGNAQLLRTASGAGEVVFAELAAKAAAFALDDDALYGDLKLCILADRARLIDLKRALQIVRLDTA